MGAAKAALLEETVQVEETSSTAESEAVSKHAFELTCRLASAMAQAPHLPMPQPPGVDDFEKLFGVQGDGPVEEFLRKLSNEQRLFWELQPQNLLDHSANFDRQLWEDLKAAGREADAELLATTTGQPSLRETQYRPLLWLRLHPNLDASYTEPLFEDTSLLILACQSGLREVAGELVRRAANVSQTSRTGVSALSTTCSYENVELTRLLLENKADPNDAVEGRTALLIAAGLKDKDAPQKRAGEQVAGT